MAAPALQQWALVFRGCMALQQGAWRAVRKVLKALAVLAPNSTQVMQPAACLHSGVQHAAAHASLWWPAHVAELPSSCDL